LNDKARAIAVIDPALALAPPPAILQVLRQRRDLLTR